MPAVGDLLRGRVGRSGLGAGLLGLGDRLGRTANGPAALATVTRVTDVTHIALPSDLRTPGVPGLSPEVATIHVLCGLWMLGVIDAIDAICVMGVMGVMGVIHVI
ncbi:hypothetical protein [Streptomyces sp. NPDC053367]|uniref:hypothetical protein n=1 Tax=Streptomyces sp. NPDC053367 TaxID=3365700 RepID=UPI0037D536F2